MNDKQNARIVYADIINLPHFQSQKRPHMSLYDRAVYPAPKTAAARGLNRTLAAHLTAHGLPDIISTAHIV